VLFSAFALGTLLVITILQVRPFFLFRQYNFSGQSYKCGFHIKILFFFGQPPQIDHDAPINPREANLNIFNLGCHVNKIFATGKFCPIFRLIFKIPKKGVYDLCWVVQL
jgi:hypothetical protein